MAVLSAASIYAIRAALFVAVADLEPEAYLSTRRIAESLEVPFPFLTKALQGLTRSGILVSQRGAGGGVALGRPSSRITVFEIIASVGGDHVFDECVLGLPFCSAEVPCALHGQWTVQREELERSFRRTTLADLAADGSAATACGLRARGKASEVKVPRRRKGEG
jgi:Rrf2 family protein